MWTPCCPAGGASRHKRKPTVLPDDRDRFPHSSSCWGLDFHSPSQGCPLWLPITEDPLDSPADPDPGNSPCSVCHFAITIRETRKYRCYLCSSWWLGGDGRVFSGNGEPAEIQGTRQVLAVSTQCPYQRSNAQLLVDTRALLLTFLETLGSIAMEVPLFCPSHQDLCLFLMSSFQHPIGAWVQRERGRTQTPILRAYSAFPFYLFRIP